jgi:lipid II:glycine glycyltransferase (peptidoglycan interpeptide bridge formation enzyme)
MILYKKANLRVAELWFDEEVDQTHFDIVRHFQRTTPGEEGKWTRFSTILLDLEDDRDKLFQRMGKTNRYEIRRAETRDNFRYAAYATPDTESVNRFEAFYDRHASPRGIGQTGQARMKKFAEAGALVLSEVQSERNIPLAWHAYYCTKDRARLLYSVSLATTAADKSHRSWLGRANRFLHWRDALVFKERGVCVYDFGGWYDGQTDPKKLSINRFKEEFGGEVVPNYNGLLGVSSLGKAALWVYARLPGRETG